MASDTEALTVVSPTTVERSTAVTWPWASVVVPGVPTKAPGPLTMDQATVAPGTALPYWSVTVAVKVWLLPTTLVSDSGVSTRLKAGPGVTVRAAPSLRVW